MKIIQSTITYEVPHWNFCNSDHIDIDGSVSKPTCRFYKHTKDGSYCTLYQKHLVHNDNLIEKVRACCEATAGYTSVVSMPQVPTIQPSVIIRQTIDQYQKTVQDLLNQGYPQAMAAQLAKQYITGG